MAVGERASRPGADANARIRRRYRRDTLILETEFTTPDGSGAVVLIDFMPLRGGRAPSISCVW